MKGYVYVDPAGFESDSNLRKWVDLCIRFNASLHPNETPGRNPAPASISVNSP
jgi:hypothetical protein